MIWSPLRFALLFTLALALVLPEASPVSAGGSSEGGRVGNPKRLRAQREGRPPGRKMSRPPVPEPEQRVPLKSSALIPNPEPSERGGSGYARRGKYFYETPKAIELSRRKPGSGYKATVPRPEKLGTERRARDGRRR